MRDEETKKRFIREAQAASALDHSNICTIYEISETSDLPDVAGEQLFIVMAYYQGKTLQEKIRQAASVDKSNLSINESLEIAIQIASGLQNAHEKGIVHRDIKPANIIVTDTGIVKIVDFGLAKLIDQTMITRIGSTVGTVAYMSPEQAVGDKLDHRTDIWSLGVIMYEMITGQRPFRGEYEQALIYTIINNEPEPIQNYIPDIPADLVQIINRSLEKNQDYRYASVAEMLKDLKNHLYGLQPGEQESFNRQAPHHANKKPRKAVQVRLAVLPFINLSGDPEQEYLSDGLTQEMITQLGRLHPQSLGVIARTSVMRYKKSDIPIDQIGRELKVDYVLEGSTRREGSRVRISADLINVRDQMQLWGDIFEKDLSGILILQSEVAESVAKALSIKLLPSEKDQLAKVRPVDPEAHEAYLRGMFHCMKVTPGDLDTAEKHFDLALEKDPLFAPAYVGRALVWVIRNQAGITSPGEAGPKAKAAALRALELDANSADAYYVLASVRTYIDWDWDGAGEFWRRTLELNPNVAVAQALYAHFLAITGHVEEARVHSEKAAVLDPFNPLVQSWHAQVLYTQHRYDEAIAVAHEAQRIDPDHPIVGFTLWIIMHEKKGMEKEAFEAIKAFMVAIYQDPRLEAALEEGYAHGGYADAMKRGAESLIARLPETFSLPNDIGNFYLAAGEKDKAIEWLEKGFEVHDPVSPYVSCLPIYDDIRPDPRIQDLLRRMNLPVDELDDR